MLAASLRIIFGFVLACLAGAITQVLFVITPADLYALEGGERWEQAGRALAVALSAATQFAVFSAPFAGVAILIGSLQRFRGWGYYVFAGLAIALLGFAVLYAAEESSEFTIANGYALAAFAFSGIIAGYVYWLIAGRSAGPRYGLSEPGVRPRPAAESVRQHLKLRELGGARAATGESSVGLPDPGIHNTH